MVSSRFAACGGSWEKKDTPRNLESRCESILKAIAIERSHFCTRLDHGMRICRRCGRRLSIVFFSWFGLELTLERLYFIGNAVSLVGFRMMAAKGLLYFENWLPSGTAFLSSTRTPDLQVLTSYILYVLSKLYWIVHAWGTICCYFCESGGRSASKRTYISWSLASSRCSSVVTTKRCCKQ